MRHQKPVYANCPCCGGTFAVTRRGYLRSHRNPDKSKDAPWECPQIKKNPQVRDLSPRMPPGRESQEPPMGDGVTMDMEQIKKAFGADSVETLAEASVRLRKEGNTGLADAVDELRGRTDEEDPYRFVRLRDLDLHRGPNTVWVTTRKSCSCGELLSSSELRAVSRELQARSSKLEARSSKHFVCTRCAGVYLVHDDGDPSSDVFLEPTKLLLDAVALAAVRRLLRHPRHSFWWKVGAHKVRLSKEELDDLEVGDEVVVAWNSWHGDRHPSGRPKDGWAYIRATVLRRTKATLFVGDDGQERWAVGDRSVESFLVRRPPHGEPIRDAVEWG